jgi:DNA topoisomerase-1
LTALAHPSEWVPKQNRIFAHVDPYEAAALAGLHYSSPEGVGVKRVRTGRGSKYVDSEGRAVTDRAFLRRVRSLVIPPAWESVWVSADPNGHIQAVGWDAKGRKQYRYHPLYREVRDHAKFDRLVEFGRVLPKIRAAVSADLAVKGLPQRKVVAVVVRLLEETCIRVGNEEYERLNGSFGLTTMKSRHVTIEGSELRFRFKGKSGQTHDILMKNTRLARIVRACQCIPGYELFQYKDETGEVHSVKSEDVNAYLSEISNGSFTAKDFRTWAGTCAAADFLRQREPVTTKSDFKRVTAEVVKLTAEKLGNRAATCRKYYIHPVVFTAFENGALFKAFEKYGGAGETPESELKLEEQAVLHILESAPALLPQVVKMKMRRKVRSTGIRTRVTVRIETQAAELAS